MQDFNIVTDIHGRARALEKLLKKVPKARILSLGDAVDNGNDSKAVLDILMDSNAIHLLGNHEHMMVDMYDNIGFYHRSSWLCFQEGDRTLMSFGYQGSADDLKCMPELELRAVLASYIPKRYIEWIKRSPLYYQAEGLLATHAPKNPCLSLDQASVFEHCGVGESVLWNSGSPRRIKDVFQVHGHLLQIHEPKHYMIKDTDIWWGSNINTEKVLTCMHWPSKQLFFQEVDDDEVIFKIPA